MPNPYVSFSQPIFRNPPTQQYATYRQPPTLKNNRQAIQNAKSRLQPSIGVLRRNPTTPLIEMLSDPTKSALMDVLFHGTTFGPIVGILMGRYGRRTGLISGVLTALGIGVGSYLYRKQRNAKYEGYIQRLGLKTTYGDVKRAEG